MGFLRELREAFGIETADDTRDIRGWAVLDMSGMEVGKVDDLIFDADREELRYAIVNLRDRRVLLPISELDIDEAKRRIVARGFTRDRLMRLREYTGGGLNETVEREHLRDHLPDMNDSTLLDYRNNKLRGQMPRRLQLLEEQLRVAKVREKLGEASISKRPVTENVEEKVTLNEEKVDITRRPVNRPVTGNERISMEGDTVSIPLFGERADVNKETFVREEVEIGKRNEERMETIRDTVRREELVTDEGKLDRDALREKLQDKDREPILDRDALRDRDRELTFTGTEPTEEERRRKIVDRVDIVPEEDTINRDVL